MTKRTLNLLFHTADVPKCCWAKTGRKAQTGVSSTNQLQNIDLSDQFSWFAFCYGCLFGVLICTVRREAVHHPTTGHEIVSHLRAFFAACKNGSKWFVDKTGTRSAFCAPSHHHLQQHQRHEYATLSRYNFHAARQSKDELEARWKICQFGGGFQYQVLNSISWCKPKL